MKEEQGAEYYDKAYTERPQYGLNVDSEHSWHSDLYAFVLTLLNKEEMIVELGCGSGQFAETLLKNGYNYAWGVDFSVVAIEMCIQRTKKQWFEVGDLYKINMDFENDTYLCLETMEHIYWDLTVLAKIPKGKRIVFSVPNFDDFAHVRFFSNKEEVENHYGYLFTNFTVHTVNRYFVIDARV